MYPWEAINPKQDTTIRIIHECVSRGHNVALTTASNLTIRDSITMSFCKIFDRSDKVSASITSFL